jgi:choice-of-anchor A domain-containing protein
MKLFLVLLTLSAGVSAQTLSHFSVFSTNNITYDRSDFEGNVAATKIKVTDFLFNNSEVLASQSLEQVRGAIKGTVKSGYGIWLLNTSVQSNKEILLTSDVMNIDMSSVAGYVRTNWLNIPTNSMGFPSSAVLGKKGFSRSAAQVLKTKIETTLADVTSEMIEMSKSCHDMEAKDAEVVGNKIMVNANEYYYTAVNISADEINRYKNVVINGTGIKNSLIINVSGENIDFTNIGFEVKNISPDQIIWNLFEAKTLNIYHSGSSELYNGRAIGFPGTVLAPTAVTKFYEAVITGNLWVNNLDGSNSNTKIHGGQVNYAPYAGYPCKEPRIIIIKE